MVRNEWATWQTTAVPRAVGTGDHKLRGKDMLSLLWVAGARRKQTSVARWPDFWRQIGIQKLKNRTVWAKETRHVGGPWPPVCHHWPPGKKSTGTGTRNSSWSGLGFFPKPHQFPLLLVLSLPVTQQTRHLVESTGSTASQLAQILTVTKWRCPWAGHSTSLSSASNNTLFHWLQLYFPPCLCISPTGMHPIVDYISVLWLIEIFSVAHGQAAEPAIHLSWFLRGSHKITLELSTIFCAW